eukprot:scaffold60937_cov21-Prasinocladus_malaysianus.AAC.2
MPAPPILGGFHNDSGLGRSWSTQQAVINTAAKSPGDNTFAGSLKLTEHSDLLKGYNGSKQPVHSAAAAAAAVDGATAFVT